MFAQFRSSGNPYKNMCLICQFAMCLPSTNVERIFSIMNNTCNHMTTPNLKVFLVTRANFDDTCPQFHISRLSANNSILGQIHCPNKYVYANLKSVCLCIEICFFCFLFSKTFFSFRLMHTIAGPMTCHHVMGRGVISRYKPFSKSGSYGITSGRVHLDADR